MTEWEIVRRRVTIAGRVIYPETGGGASGASVRLVEMPDILRMQVDMLRSLGLGAPGSGHPFQNQTFTAPDGSFFFLDLPAGSYGLAAELGSGPSRRESAAVGVELTEERGEVPMRHVEITLGESG